MNDFGFVQYDSLATEGIIKVGLAIRELTAKGEADISELTIHDVALIYRILDVDANAAHFKMRGEQLRLEIQRPLLRQSTTKEAHDSHR